MLFALRDTVVFFFTPSELASKTIKTGSRLRIGGLVKLGSVTKMAGQQVTFVITDGNGDLQIDYAGLLPDLFREGQGVIVEGVYQAPNSTLQNIFHADSVLAKHDERYMPREIAESLKAKGLAPVIIEVGLFALILAFTLALIQGIVPFWGAYRRDPHVMRLASWLAIGQFGFIALAYGILTYAHIIDDFSVLNVFENSHSLKPLVYKISGVWGNHEGSMLLWVLILSLFGAMLAVLARTMPAVLKANVLGVQALVSLAFLAFILFTSNPFARLFPAPMEGRDLNPILQDPGLAIHPPLLYLGYVGFSLSFSFAAAALIDGRIDAAWARWARPWILTAWIFLTLGIAMGSYWAYYTLGWGGFWFWDPVENASLMPWLAGTALLHSALVMEKRNALKIWTIFLAIVAFSLSLLGTFLVRSGVLTSVHAFATDPRRGIFILAILVIFIGGSLALYAWRASRLQAGGLFAPVSREGALVANNLLLTVSCATILVGTLYPLALEAVTGEKISVGAPYFNLCAAILMWPLLALVPVGQSLSWKRGKLLGVAQRLVFALCSGFGVLVFILAFRSGGPVLAPVGIAFAVYIVFGAFSEIASRIYSRNSGLAAVWQRLIGLPISAFGTAFAHAGVGIVLLGLSATGWGIEEIVALRQNQPVSLGPYELVMDRMFSRRGPNYDEAVAQISIRNGGIVVAQIEPAKRNYAARRMGTTKAGIASLNLGQVYVSMADANADGSVNMRMYWKPMVTLIWLGAIIMAFGGLLSLLDRRLRLGVPVKAARRDAPSVTAQAVQVDEILQNPALEHRARELSAQLRCLVCQNQSIDDSDAPLARDLRLLVRERLTAGDTDEAVKAYLVDRYGEFILLRPTFSPKTYILWFFPILFLGLGVVVLAFQRRRQELSVVPAMSVEEAASLQRILERESGH
eukprot:gene13999-14117_t